jgi:hypothetical protein
LYRQIDEEEKSFDNIRNESKSNKIW